MASKNNKFATTKGGAMLPPDNNAQPSFNDNSIREARKMHNNHKQTSVDNENPNNPSNLEDADKPEGKEKEILKKGAEKALEGAGVPNTLAKDIVKKADESGTLDKIVKKVNQKKKVILMKLVAAITPLLLWLAGIVLFIVIIIYIARPIIEAVNFIRNLFNFSTEEEIDNYFDNIDANDLTGKMLYQIRLTEIIPDSSYFDNNDITGDNKDEVEKISQIVAGIMAPAAYYDTIVNDIRIRDLKTDDADIILAEDLAKFFARGLIYKKITDDACMLAYAGLKSSSGISYYEAKNPDYGKAWDAIANNECADTIGEQWSADENFIRNNKDSNIEELGTNYRSSLKTFSKAKNGTTPLLSLSGSLKNISNYSFDLDTYKKFLEEFYAEKFLNETDIYNDFFNNFSDIGEEEREKILSEVRATDVSISSFASNVANYQNSLEIQTYSDFSSKLDVGSGGEPTIIENLYSIYGDAKCAILEQYVPIAHEYVTGTSFEDNEIHSVSDGEVIYVNYDGVNLYDYFDYKTNKCLCNGITCNNYDGSEVKIKFSYDDIEYIATYSNLAEIKVSVGDIVKKGDVIALEGDTGCTSGKKLTFKLVSENGISYNTNDLFKRCSSSSSTANICNFQSLNVNVNNCNNETTTIPFYQYIKEETYNNFKNGISNEEFLKAGVVLTTTKLLHNNNFKVGTTTINIKNCNYKKTDISDADSLSLDKAISATIGQVLVYNNNFANVKYSNTCTRTDKDKNANAVYNELCLKEAKNFNDKTYDEILKIYYPNFHLIKNYCLDYASKINSYSLNNDKKYLSKAYTDSEIEKINSNLKSKIEFANYGTRAGVIEAARFLVLGAEYKIPYKNGGKYFEYGFNKNWYIEGIDSSGFVSWALLNGGAKITKSTTIKDLVTNNTRGNLKITSDLYKYYDEIQVGDFAYNDSKIGLIIGKNDGILYIAESDSNKGLIVTQITSYGESDSKYTSIYFADDYYDGVGNVTSMW